MKNKKCKPTSKRYSPHFIWGQLHFWERQTISDPSASLSAARYGTVSLPDVDCSFSNNASDYTKSVRNQLCHNLEHASATQWSNRTHWRFKNAIKLFGAPWLDDVIDNIESGEMFVIPPPVVQVPKVVSKPIIESSSSSENEADMQLAIALSMSMEQTSGKPPSPSSPPPSPPSPSPASIKILPKWLTELKNTFGWKNNKSISNKQPVLSSSSMSSSTFSSSSSSSSSSSLMKKNKKKKKKIAPPLSTATHDLHNSLCQTCGGIGDLLCCDFCNFVYHMECLPANEIIPEEPAKWACPACMQEKRHSITKTTSSSSSTSSSSLSSKSKVVKQKSQSVKSRVSTYTGGAISCSHCLRDFATPGSLAKHVKNQVCLNKSNKNNNNKKKGKRKATTTTAVVNEAPIDKKQKVSRSEKGTGTIASVDSDPFGTSSSASSSSSALSEHSSDDDDPMSDADNILFKPLGV